MTEQAYTTWIKSSDREKLFEIGRKIVDHDRTKYSQVQDVIDMADDEIQEGGSPDHEFELAYSELKSILDSVSS